MPEAPKTVLSLQGVHAYYGDSHVLQGVSLDVPTGKAVALLGRNGAGKTTTINSVMGFVTIRGGVVNFKGGDITHAPSYRIAKLGLGLVPQGRRIFPNLSVRENITVTARNSGEKMWGLEQAFEMFPVLAERAKNWGNQLSGGEQQMLAIARALATNPDLVLMDEPSEGLAPIIVQNIRDTILELKTRGFSILLVEQNFGMAVSVADLIYIMSRGQVVWSGTPDELQAQPELKKQHLGV